MFRLTRMEVTLGCLVASMTLGAAMLDWFQPNQSAAPWRTTDLMARHLQEAIHISGRGDLPASTWHGIRLDPHPAGQREGLDQFDIVIDREGNYTLTGSKQRESNPDRHNGIIRIGLLTHPTSNEATVAQSLTTGKLVGILQQQCGISEQNVDKNGRLVLHPLSSVTGEIDDRLQPVQTGSFGR
ncbi:MAG: hypothetical protein GXY44_15575 [Phycisphaerales bacterium]|nr:hypothetical protein [Phycisphaerales bacterium]